MRTLPDWGPFDLVTCLDDSVNHLVDPADVRATLAGIGRNLAPDGRLIFDVNTLAAYRSPGDRVIADRERVVAWNGKSASLAESGGVCEVAIDIFERESGERWKRSTFRQPHRHHPLDEVREHISSAGLCTLAMVGQRPGGLLDDRVDDELHHKAVFVVGHAA